MFCSLFLSLSLLVPLSLSPPVLGLVLSLGLGGLGLGGLGLGLGILGPGGRGLGWWGLGGLGRGLGLIPTPNPNPKLNNPNPDVFIGCVSGRVFVCLIVYLPDDLFVSGRVCLYHTSFKFLLLTTTKNIISTVVKECIPFDSDWPDPDWLYTRAFKKEVLPEPIFTP
jgi:hypothetical protein